jgi:hypothetical protein
MTIRRPTLPAIGAIVCGAFALWVSCGALTFTDPSVHTTRVGVLPPLSWLAVLLAAALAATFVFRPDHRRVMVLWLSAIVLIPWLPLRLPLPVFMWVGPLRVWLWTAIVICLVVPLARERMPGPIARALETPQSAARLAAFLAAILFAAGGWAVTPRLPAGDEPHYLVIAQSLILDHDIQIENNHKRGDYGVYFGAILKPDYVRRGTNGAIYSIHAPGLPALIAPVFAVFGYTGVKVALILLSACATGLVWLIAWRCTGKAAAAWFGWATVTCSTPFFFHSFAVYPDTPAAAIVALAVWTLVDERARRPARLLLLGLAIGALPWLHTRFAILAPALTLVLAARLVTMPGAIKRLTALCLPALMSAAAWFLFFWWIYGTPSPAAPYGGGSGAGLAFVPAGVTGLFFDQQFGLMPNAPAFLCVALGFLVMLRRQHRRLALELLIIALPYSLVVAAFPMWWGGYSAPSRFLVPLILTGGAPAAIWFATRKTDAARITGIALLGLSALITVSIASIDRGAPLFNTRDGFSLLLLRMAPVVDLTRGLPSAFQTPPPILAFHAAVWLLAIACPPAIAGLLDRRGWNRAALVLVVGFGWTFTAMAATAFIWTRNQPASVAREAGGLEVLRRYDADRRQMALSYQPFRRLAMTELPPRMVLAHTNTNARRPEDPILYLTQPVAGVYEVEGVTRPGGSGHIRVRLDRQLPGIEDWDVSSAIGPWRRTIRLPAATDLLRFDADAEARKSVLRLSIRALQLPGSAAGYRSDVRVIRGTRYGPAVVFQTDGAAYMEPAGTWVRAGAFADFIIVPDPDARVRLFIRNVGAANRVRVDSASWKEQLALSAGEERLLEVPGDAGRFVSVRVTSDTGARPADVDPNSTDRRLLGCWIETR